jgi:hypothetical protein
LPLQIPNASSTPGFEYSSNKILVEEKKKNTNVLKLGDNKILVDK